MWAIGHPFAPEACCLMRVRLDQARGKKPFVARSPVPGARRGRDKPTSATFRSPAGCTKIDRRATASPLVSSWYPSSHIHPSNVGQSSTRMSRNMIGLWNCTLAACETCNRSPERRTVTEANRGTAGGASPPEPRPCPDSRRENTMPCRARGMPERGRTRPGVHGVGCGRATGANTRRRSRWAARGRGWSPALTRPVPTVDRDAVPDPARQVGSAPAHAPPPRPRPHRPVPTREGKGGRYDVLLESDAPGHVGPFLETPGKLPSLYVLY